MQGNGTSFQLSFLPSQVGHLFLTGLGESFQMTHIRPWGKKLGLDDRRFEVAFGLRDREITHPLRWYFNMQGKAFHVWIGSFQS